MAISIKDKAEQQRQNAIFIRPDTIHPGFPTINAIESLKNKTIKITEQEINMAVKDIKIMSNVYEGDKGASLRKESNNLLRLNKKQPMLGMAAYFKTTDLKSGMDAINKVIREKMELAMLRGANKGVEDTANHIRNMTRQFKSSYIPHKAVSGDLYHTIADSLEAHDMQAGRQQNQFISMRSGSYDDTDDAKNPTGVKGSRMGPSDPSLTELTSRNVKPFKIASKIAGTKRLKRLLKGRNIAGLKRRG